MSPPVAWALRYAAIGWPVVPQRRSHKAPLTPHAALDATMDEGTIRAWWRRWPSANVAICCRSLLVVDFDRRHGGDAKLAELVSHYGPLPETPRDESGSGPGSGHFFFRRPAFETKGAIAPGVEIIAGNRLVTVEPSIHASGGRYRWIVPPSFPLAEVPPWLAAFAQRPLPAAPVRYPDENTRERRIERARRYAARMDPAISGSEGSRATIRAASLVCNGFDLDVDDALDVLSDWNASCAPPWSESELRRKVEQAARYGRIPRGALLGNRPAETRAAE